MTITSSNLAAHELIGLKVTISNSSDPTTVGLTGTVRDESRNMLTIQVNQRFLQIPKKGSNFAFELPSGQQAKIDGSSIQFRPEDRVKRRQRNW